jgi:hypothetical protein
MTTADGGRKRGARRGPMTGSSLREGRGYPRPVSRLRGGESRSAGGNKAPAQHFALDFLDKASTTCCVNSTGQARARLPRPARRRGLGWWKRCDRRGASHHKERALSGLSDSQHLDLTTAAERADGALLPLPDGYAAPGRARGLLLRDLNKRGLISERPVQNGGPAIAESDAEPTIDARARSDPAADLVIEQIRALESLSVGELRARWVEAYGAPPPPRWNRALLVRSAAPSVSTGPG